MKIYILFFVFLSTIPGCNYSETEVKSPISVETLEKNLPQIDNQELFKIRSNLIRSMLNYMEYENVQYTKENVADAGEILTNHYLKLAHAKTKEEADNLVRETVIKLNHLNTLSQYQLIETDQRELIGEFIIKSGVIFGFNKTNEDVTERWRKW